MLRSEIGGKALQSPCQSSRKRDGYGSRTCRVRVSDSWGTPCYEKAPQNKNIRILKRLKIWYNIIGWFYIINKEKNRIESIENKDKNRKIRNKYLISKKLGWDIDHPNIEGD